MLERLPLKRWIFTSLVVLQTLLVLTGGAVRLTGSGLGCPTWPDCVSGSIAPVPHQAQGALHSWIEFGNRLLTILLVVVILAAVLAAIYWGRKLPSWRSIRALAIAQILGIIGQIVLGGITVLTKLNPFAVSSHFLLSIVLIAASLALREEMLGRETVALAPIPRAMARAILGICAFVLMIGTVVTGSGPHAGDIHAKRYHIDPRLISWMHADAVIALISLTIGLYLIVRVSESLEIRSFMEPKILTFLGLCLGQGVIGYVQYFTHLPEALVAAHLLGAATIWLAAWNIANAASLFTRSKKTAS